MVFSGQDAWRKHPLIYQCYRSPLPGLRTAVGIFAAYLTIDYVISASSAPTHHHHGPKITFKESGDCGDTTPSVKIKKGGHH